MSNLEAIGRLTIEYFQAQNRTKKAKQVKKAKYDEFCINNLIDIFDKYTNSGHPQYEEMITYALAEVDAYDAAKRKEVSIKRRLERAVCNAILAGER